MKAFFVEESISAVPVFSRAINNVWPGNSFDSNLSKRLHGVSLMEVLLTDESTHVSPCTSN